MRPSRAKLRDRSYLTKKQLLSVRQEAPCLELSEPARPAACNSKGIRYANPRAQAAIRLNEVLMALTHAVGSMSIVLRARHSSNTARPANRNPTFQPQPHSSRNATLRVGGVNRDRNLVAVTLNLKLIP